MILAVLRLSVSYGQNEATNATLSYSQTWFNDYPSASDSIQDGDSIITYVVQKYVDTKSTARFRCSLDSVGGTAAPVTIYLQKKNWQAQTFSNVDTATWTAGADTVINFVTTTAGDEDYWRIYIIGSTDSFNAFMDGIWGKFIKQ